MPCPYPGASQCWTLQRGVGSGVLLQAIDYARNSPPIPTLPNGHLTLSDAFTASFEMITGFISSL